ncbi:copper chaperone PCu(A)C [Actinoalloteichus sp. AHMU CJ021]|uniref:copper chaperone PCu(A)C n=1 Tax=Actinoalloteichus TaxID=65496 RepID=UPI0004AB1600|nr:copper chaperone PCu(A)C [Actinoalloteichus caeruleus]AUS78903.1 copper chaperone PCu(A)C [Actinoalloteichus sp. AHMU CJ021]
MNSRKTASLVSLTAATAFALAACASTDEEEPAEAAPAADVIRMDDAWVKAAEEGMSAAFGELANSGDEDVTVVSVTTPASTVLELHETVENEAGAMVMREVEGGFVVPASGSLSLEPGGDHIMLMDLTGPLDAGEDVTFTLTFSDDSTFEFSAPVKEYSGANESYEGGDSEHDMDMDH